jgi:ferredoxin
VESTTPNPALLTTSHRRFFEPDILLASKHLTARPLDSPCRRLVAAVLEHALLDADGLTDRRSDGNDALAWFRSDDEAPFSFRWVAAQLGFDAEWLRSRVRERQNTASLRTGECGRSSNLREECASRCMSEEGMPPGSPDFAWRGWHAPRLADERCGGGAMKVRLDATRCVGHGRCYELAPAVFVEDPDGRARLLGAEVPAGQERAVQLAVANCPEGALRIDES